MLFGKNVAHAEQLANVGWPSANTAAITVRRGGGAPKLTILEKYRKKSSVHEIGHVVYRNANRETLYGIEDCWRAKASNPRSPKIAAYSLTEKEEYFAESFQAYVNEPAKLRKVDKTMYSIIKNEVFDGFEWN